MERIPEPELMESEEQTEAYAKADFEESNSLFINLIKDELPSIKTESRILDLGCGPGDISIRLSETYPDVYIDAVDGSKSMLDYAQKRIEKSPTYKCINLIHSYLSPDKKLDYQYDCIISNSVLHHFHDPLAFWKLIRHHAHDTCYVFVMDLIRPPSSEDAQNIVNRYSADEDNILKEDFYNSLLAAFTEEELNEQLRETGLSKELVYKVVSDRHFMVSGKLT